MPDDHTTPTPASIGAAPGKLPLIGHAWWLYFRPLEFLTAQRPLGDLVAFWPGPKRAYVVNDPELIHQMLTLRRSDFIRGGPAFEAVRILEGDSIATTHGEVHRRNRRFVQPAFHSARLPDYSPVMQEVAAATSGSWQDGQPVAVNDQMYRLSTTVVAKCLYSGPLAAEAVDEIVRSLPIAFKGVGQRAALPVPWLHDLPTPGHRRFKQAVNRLKALTARLIAERRTSHAEHDDALSALMAARDEQTGAPMSDQQIHDEFITLLVAASETTAQALAWALHLLGAWPDVEAKLHAEVDAVTAGRPVTHDDLPRLTYVRATVNETLRMFPPAWLMPRLAVTDTHLGGHPIPAGTYVYYSPYANHHDPALFPHPDVFDPSRWLPDQAKPARCAHIPFAAGVHKCIGDTFALNEATIVLATIAARWRLRPRTDRPIRPRGYAILSTGPLTMTAEQR
ncbi:cytochrome P450 [Streptomyces virginiae]|uniref:cytochrome P450 n=1 Tax=Streptomyces virginiae TaxID=1961 RepID=UPI003683EB42